MKQTTQPTTRIREIRKARGITLRELANAIGTTPQTIQRLETANMTVSMKWLGKIGLAFGLKPHDLLPNPDDQPTPERDFLNMLRDALIYNRRSAPALEDALPMLLESLGRLSGLMLEYRRGLRPWDEAHAQALAVAAGAMRIAIDGKTLRKVKLGEAA